MLFRGLPVEYIIILIPVLLFSLCFHEFSHAFIAYKLGDDTAERMGRLNISPLNHLDPMGTMMLLFVGFGWAKPVPVNPYNLKDPKKDMMLIAAAGPISNLILAFLGSILLKYLPYNLISNLPEVFYLFIYINIALAIFNLIPLPPLDGSQIISGLLPPNKHYLLANINKYGPNILLGLIFLGIFTNINIIHMIMSPFINFFMFIFLGQNV